MSSRSPKVIKLQTLTGGFAENKDVAAKLREKDIRPALKEGRNLVLDFSGVRVATQSFVHALISDVLRTRGVEILDSITFKRCAPAVKGVVETVVQYTLESIEPEEAEKQSGGPPASEKKIATAKRTKRQASEKQLRLKGVE